MRVWAETVFPTRIRFCPACVGTLPAVPFKCWRCKAALCVEAGLRESGSIRPRTAAEAEKAR
eukprot:6893525-Lingulodinium_polyedra.AAC.1